jgi:hypothetical protein
MTPPDEPAEIFPIAYSTAYLCLAALITLRDHDADEYGDDATEYAHNILEVIKAQPETVLSLAPKELEAIGPTLIDNARAWLN